MPLVVTRYSDSPFFWVHSCRPLARKVAEANLTNNEPLLRHCLLSVFHFILTYEHLTLISRYMEWYTNKTSTASHSQPNSLSPTKQPRRQHKSHQQHHRDTEQSGEKTAKFEEEERRLLNSPSNLPDEVKAERRSLDGGEGHNQGQGHEDSSESGISSLSQNPNSRLANNNENGDKNKRHPTEKKSIFTIAYEDVSKKTVRPNSAEVLMD